MTDLNKKLGYRLESMASASCFHLIIMLLKELFCEWSYTLRVGFFYQTYMANDGYL